MQRRTAYLLLILGTFFWGVSFVVIKQGVAAYDPARFLFWRYLVATLALGLLFPKRLMALRRPELVGGAVLSLALFAGTMTQTLGLTGTSASNAGFIAGTALIFVPLFKFISDGTRLTLNFALASGLALTGLAVLSLKLPLSVGKGDLWVLASAAAYALHIVLAGRWVRRADPMGLSLVQLACCTVFCAVQAQAQGLGLQPPQSLSVWAAIGFTGLLATAFTYAAQNVAQQHVAEHEVALIFLLEPVFAGLAGHLWLAEPLTARLLIGGGLMLAAIAISELRALLQQPTRAL